MCAIAVCSLSCVSFEQFAVAKSGIEKKNGGGDAEARAQLDEAVVLEGDGVRDSTAAPPRSPLTFLAHVCVCVFAGQADLAVVGCIHGATRFGRPVGGDGSDC